jgi:hypothetical protein
VLAAADGNDWPSSHRDLTGQRYSPLKQITPANVATLETAWSFDTEAGPLQTIPIVAGVPRRAGELDLNDIRSARKRESVCSTNSRHAGERLQRSSGALVKSGSVGRVRQHASRKPHCQHALGLEARVRRTQQFETTHDECGRA